MTIIVARADYAQQIHVGSGATPGQITFTWSTLVSTPTTAARVALAGANSWTTFLGSEYVFINGTNVWEYHYVNASLSPATTYTYQLGCLLTGFSSNFTLKVPVSSGPTNFIIFGDLDIQVEGEETWQEITSIVNSTDIEAIIHLGDIAYDLSTNYATWGDSYMQAIQPVASQIPYMVTPGNHEADDDYVNYQTRFTMPGNGFYYTWTAGLVRFLSLNTEVFLDGSGGLPNMLSYIQNTLNRTTSDRQQFPWMVVYGHRPLYCSSKAKAKSCGPESAILQGYVENWFKTLGVDLYLNGHVHNYERTTPVYQGNPLNTTTGATYYNPQATIYVTSGGAGSDGDNSKVLIPGPAWLSAWDNNISYSYLTVYNSTHLQWQQWLTGQNKTTDQFWIIKNSSVVTE